MTQRDYRQMACGDGMCWQGPLCEVIDDLKAENERLREALQTIHDTRPSRGEARDIAWAALSAASRTKRQTPSPGVGAQPNPNRPEDHA